MRIAMPSMPESLSFAVVAATGEATSRRVSAFRVLIPWRVVTEIAPPADANDMMRGERSLTRKRE